MKIMLRMELENKEGVFVRLTGIQSECLAKKYKYEFELNITIIANGTPNNDRNRLRTNSVTEGNKWLLKVASEI